VDLTGNVNSSPLSESHVPTSRSPRPLTMFLDTLSETIYHIETGNYSAAADNGRLVKGLMDGPLWARELSAAA
jgi:hypothetical protein